MDTKYRQLLAIPHDRLDAINSVLLDPNSRVMKAFFDVVAKYGTAEEINRKHLESRKYDNLLKHVQARAPGHVKDLQWLIEQRDNQRFVSIADYRKKILGNAAGSTKFADMSAVTLEVSALQYFPWVRPMTERAENCIIMSLGSGPHAHGQLLIYHDMFGLYPKFKPKMAKVFGNAGEVILNGLKGYHDEVISKQFPQRENWFTMPDEEYDELIKRLQ